MPDSPKLLKNLTTAQQSMAIFDSFLDSLLTTSGILVLTVTAVGLGCIFLFYRFCLAPFHVLKRYGIMGPRPTLVLGNMGTIGKKGGYLEFLNYMYTTYGGPVSGYYMGTEPSVIVTDPELIKQITVKEFNSFMDHVNIGNFIPDPYGNTQGLFAETGETWREHRHVLTPAFSASKMKMMVPLIKRSTDTLVEKMGEVAESGKSTDVMKVYGEFTMESILAVAFGRVINIQRGEADEVTEAAKGIFAAGKSPTVQMCMGIVALFRSMARPVQYYLSNHTKFVEPFKVLYHTALKLIETRRTGAAKQAKYKDILQLMLDASEDANDQPAAASATASTTSTGCPMHQSSVGSDKNKLTNKDLVNLAVSFLGAGYETTANTISYTSYLLAINPDIQEKLQSEIDSYFDDKPDATFYEATHEITYLDNVIQEALRIYPTASLTNRVCLETTTIGEVTFPKGAQIIIPIMELHHDSKYWEEPEKFDPDRFTPEEKAKRPATVHMPFGFGPRNCIGMRFALMEAKMALIELLKRYTFVRAPDTEVPLKTMLGFTLTPKNNAIFLKVVPRN